MREVKWSEGWRIKWRVRGEAEGWRVRERWRGRDY